MPPRLVWGWGSRGGRILPWGFKEHHAAGADGTKDTGVLLH